MRSQEKGRGEKGEEQEESKQGVVPGSPLSMPSLGSGGGTAAGGESLDKAEDTLTAEGFYSATPHD